MSNHLYFILKERFVFFLFHAKEETFSQIFYRCDRAQLLVGCANISGACIMLQCTFSSFSLSILWPLFFPCKNFLMLTFFLQAPEKHFYEFLRNKQILSSFLTDLETSTFMLKSNWIQLFSAESS